MENWFPIFVSAGIFFPDYLKFWELRGEKKISYCTIYARRNAIQSDFTSFSHAWMCSFLLTKGKTQKNCKKRNQMVPPDTVSQLKRENKPSFFCRHSGLKKRVIILFKGNSLKGKLLQIQWKAPFITTKQRSCLLWLMQGTCLSL